MRTMMLGGFAIAAAMAMQAASLPHRSVQAVRAPSLARLVTPQQAVEPSAYDVESGLTPKQLLDRWDADISMAAKRFKVPKAWIRAVMARESGGRTMLGQGQPMISPAGAIGLMQVMPGTYAEMRAEHGLGDNAFDTHDNIMAGTAYLRWLHRKYGYPRMFAAYNAGPGRLEDHIARGSTLPAETRAYVGGITRVLDPRGARQARLDNWAAVAAGDVVRLTRPDGGAVVLDVGKITGIRAALPGEFASSVQTVVSMGKVSQGVREPVMAATAAIQSRGG